MNLNRENLNLRLALQYWHFRSFRRSRIVYVHRRTLCEHIRLLKKLFNDKLTFELCHQINDSELKYIHEFIHEFNDFLKKLIGNLP